MYSRHSSDFCWADNIFVRPVELNFKFKKICPYFRNSDNWRNKQQLDQCKIPSDGVLIGSGTFVTILGGITIWNPWSNESYANLEDSDCTVQMLFFFPSCKTLQLIWTNLCLVPVWFCCRLNNVKEGENPFVDSVSWPALFNLYSKSSKNWLDATWILP